MWRECDATGSGLSNNLLSQPVADGHLTSAQPRIAVLLCTKQGEHFLHEQIGSILAQSLPSASIWVSDDGSSDDTPFILGTYQARLGKSRFAVVQGPGRGYAANFLSLTCHAAIVADYYAFADQDDIWETDKLSQAIDWLQTVPSHVPALYCGRTRNVDEHNRDVGFSPVFSKPPDFANALVQSIGGGNTMVFNNAARQLLCLAGSDLEVVSHDWWAYLVVSGCGGVVFYDPRPTVRYRQHENNLIGTNNSWNARLMRTGMIFRGRFSHWTDINLVALQRIRHVLTPGNQRRLDEFSNARKGSFFARLAAMKRSGVYRQTLFGNLGLVIAILFNKI